MIRRLIVCALLLCGVACLGQSEAFWQSRDSNYNGSIVSGGGSYTPPISSWTLAVAYGPCQLTSTYAGNLLAVTTISTSTNVNYGVSGSTGCVNWSAIASQCETGSVCYVQPFDQSGHANNPTNISAGFLIDAANKRFLNSGAGALTYAGVTQAQPWVTVMNFDNLSNLGNGGFYWSDTASNAGVADPSNNNVYGNASGSTVVNPKEDAYWGAVTFLADGASSSVNVVDSFGTNSTQTGSAGAVTISAANGPYAIGTNPASSSYYVTDIYFDFFVVAADPGATARAAFVTWLRANAHN